MRTDWPAMTRPFGAKAGEPTIELGETHIVADGHAHGVRPDLRDDIVADGDIEEVELPVSGQQFTLDV